MNYLMVLPVPFYRVSDDVVATESAFVEHLKQLKKSLEPEVSRITIASTFQSEAAYRKREAYCAAFSERLDGIRFVPLDPEGVSRVGYWMRHLLPNIRTIWRECRKAEVIHAGPSYVLTPREFVSILVAILMRKKSIFVVDIDWRRSARMNLETGRSSLKSYLMTKAFYSPLFSLQVRFASRFCSLVMLKSAKLVRDYGRGRASVKDLLDVAHSQQHVIDDSALEARVQHVLSRQTPLRVVYFGRLTAYKGIDRMIALIAAIKRTGGPAITLDIIGVGEEQAALEAQCRALSVEDLVRFLGPLPFGPALFNVVRRHEVLLAAPLAADTPRSALDAMASGLAVVAYDIDYYVDLEKLSGAVKTVPWRDDASMATTLIELDDRRAELAAMMLAGAAFARANTQEIWIERRAQWTKEFCLSRA
jgi:glycosyltransferase involved in cell wall biosynthesis